MTIHALPPRTHNMDPVDVALDAIQDLFDEAKNFADGEPIDSDEMHDAITKLYDALHEAGKAADALRVEAKKPLDEQIDAIQKRFNPFIQPKKGKVDIGKQELAKLLADWRAKKLAIKEAAARKARIEADRIAAEAQAAIRASSGNLTARVDAEELLAHAKAVERDARRADKAATTGTGLVTRWRSEVTNIEAALDHYYPLHGHAFVQLVEDFARVDVQMGKREIPGVRVWSEKVAR